MAAKVPTLSTGRGKKGSIFVGVETESKRLRRWLIYLKRLMGIKLKGRKIIFLKGGLNDYGSINSGDRCQQTNECDWLCQGPIAESGYDISVKFHSQLALVHLGDVINDFETDPCQDVSQKIMSFVQQRKCAVCIMSASGSISNASLRQPATLGGNVSYEGRYEILSLSGSFLHAEIGGASSRSGGLSVCLAGTDGKIVGGGVGGPLLAAGPVQVIAGSFFIDTSKDSDKKVEASSSKLPPHVVGASVTSVSYRPSPDSSGRVSFRGNDDAQNYGGNFIAQSRGTYVTSPRSSDWRGVLDARNSGNIDFTDHGAQSPDDGDDEQLGL